MMEAAGRKRKEEDENADPPTVSLPKEVCTDEFINFFDNIIDACSIYYKYQ